MTSRRILLALVVLLTSLILHPTFAHRKYQSLPPQDPKQEPPESSKKPPPNDTNETTPQDPKQKGPPPQDPNQTPSPQGEPDEGPSQSPNQSPPIPKNHLPQNPGRNPGSTTRNQASQNPPPQKQTPFHDRFKGHFSAVYAFGDSYTDTGNAQFLGSLSPSFSGSLSSPYGSTTFGKSSNRLSDGRLVIDYITDSLGLPVLPPYQSTTANFTTGANFAIAGATTLNSDLLSKTARFILWKGAPIGVWTQMDWFKRFQSDRLCKDLDKKTCSDKLKTALFWVGEIGINDYPRAVGSNIPLQTVAKSSVTYTTEITRTLIQHGAKNIVVQGLPPIGCLPLDVSLTPLSVRDKSGCSPLVNEAVTLHNQMLQSKLEMYRKMFPDVTIIYADSWKAYYTIINNSAKYQIQETQKTCCGSHIKTDDLNFNLQLLCGSSGTSICSNPSLYISWDGIHPTQSMNFHMTDLFINQDCCNPPFDELMKDRKSPS